MPSLKISLVESAYLIFMFLFFKTTMDFNVIRSPTGWWFEHLVGDHYGLRICPFGRVAIFALIFVLKPKSKLKSPNILKLIFACFEIIFSRLALWSFISNKTVM